MNFFFFYCLFCSEIDWENKCMIKYMVLWPRSRKEQFESCMGEFLKKGLIVSLFGCIMQVIHVWSTIYSRKYNKNRLLFNNLYKKKMQKVSNIKIHTKMNTLACWVDSNKKRANSKKRTMQKLSLFYFTIKNKINGYFYYSAIILLFKLNGVFSFGSTLV